MSDDRVTEEHFSPEWVAEYETMRRKVAEAEDGELPPNPFEDVPLDPPDDETEDDDVEQAVPDNATYVDDPALAPAGADVQRGPRGGFYYTPNPTPGDQDAERDAPPPPAPASARPGPTPPGRPSDAPLRVRPSPWTKAASGDLSAVSDERMADGIRSHLSDFANTNESRDYQYYLDHGELRASPSPIDELPEATRSLAEQALDAVPDEQHACYKNAQLAAIALRTGDVDDDRVAYVEGVYVDDATGAPVQHAWLEVDGHIVDPTLVNAVGRAPDPADTYFGAPISVDFALTVISEEQQARPLAIGPPRPASVREVEDATS